MDTLFFFKMYMALIGWRFVSLLKHVRILVKGCRDYFSLPFIIQRQSSPMTPGDLCGHLHLFVKVYRSRLLKSPLFVIQRQASPMTHRKKYGHLHPFIEDSTSVDSPVTISACYRTRLSRDSRGNFSSLDQ